MLSIYLGQMEEAIYYPPAYFNNTYDDEWITDPLTVEMIKDVDKSEVVSRTPFISRSQYPANIHRLFRVYRG